MQMGVSSASQIDSSGRRAGVRGQPALRRSIHSSPRLRTTLFAGHRRFLSSWVRAKVPLPNNRMKRLNVLTWICLRAVAAPRVVARPGGPAICRSLGCVGGLANHGHREGPVQQQEPCNESGLWAMVVSTEVDPRRVRLPRVPLVWTSVRLRVRESGCAMPLPDNHIESSAGCTWPGRMPGHSALRQDGQMGYWYLNGGSPVPTRASIPCSSGERAGLRCFGTAVLLRRVDGPVPDVTPEFTDCSADPGGRASWADVPYLKVAHDIGSPKK